MPSLRSRQAIPLIATLVLLAVAAVTVVRDSVFEGGDASPVAVATDSDGRLALRDLRDRVVGARSVEPTDSQLPRSSGAPVERVVVRAAGIDASVVTGYVDGNNQMIAPDGAENVAWYEYSALPGQGGNAVLSAHVDYIDYGPAVFYNLRSLAEGDLIELHLADGTVLEYRVELNEVYGAGQGPWDELFSPATDDEVITMYTCDGSWDGSDYSDRRVVRAERIA